eukprot:TRINITY_DN24376_c0_g1_i2.p1 TRINITY_DN24376_c0_g1~~TRINITY_DN24376_c0_g1_i2.p1  ORF type:complete len:170 (-),score=27.00 TRINITY_DN24376_c0_g1_i2:57-566(-)
MPSLVGSEMCIRDRQYTNQINQRCLIPLFRELEKLKSLKNLNLRFSYFSIDISNLYQMKDMFCSLQNLQNVSVEITYCTITSDNHNADLNQIYKRIFFHLRNLYNMQSCVFKLDDINDGIIELRNQCESKIKKRNLKKQAMVYQVKASYEKLKKFFRKEIVEEINEYFI